MNKRKQHAPKFKAKVAFEAIREREPISVLASRFDIHPSLIARWKRELIQQAEQVFEGQQNRALEQAQAREIELFEQIGRLKMELEWLKKKVGRFD